MNGAYLCCLHTTTLFITNTRQSVQERQKKIENKGDGIPLECSSTAHRAMK